jgi:hypothetical protein
MRQCLGTAPCATDPSPDLQVFPGPPNNTTVPASRSAAHSSCKRAPFGRRGCRWGPHCARSRNSRPTAPFIEKTPGTTELLASRFDTTASHRVSARSLHPSPTPLAAARTQSTYDATPPIRPLDRRSHDGRRDASHDAARSDFLLPRGATHDCVVFSPHDSCSPVECTLLMQQPVSAACRFAIISSF